jgi:hypothetical protein
METMTLDGIACSRSRSTRHSAERDRITGTLAPMPRS